jgi:hypothetical protein
MLQGMYQKHHCIRKSYGAMLNPIPYLLEGRLIHSEIGSRILLLDDGQKWLDVKR